DTATAGAEDAPHRPSPFAIAYEFGERPHRHGPQAYRRRVTEQAPALAPPTAHRHVLTAVEFDVLWERLRLGPTPVVLRLESPGRTHTERRAIEAVGWQALRERGLAGPSGPDPELARLLHLLSRPVQQLELRAWWGRSVRAVAAGQPGTGALAVRQDATVTIEPCGSLPSALLGVLPPARPGPGRAATVPTDVLAAATAAPTGGIRAALVARDVTPTEAGLLARMLRGVEGRAQIVALTADRWGVLRRAGGVLGVLDGPRGRYAMSRSVGEDGTEWTTVAPTDVRRLRHRVAELLEGPGGRPD
ncbi:ESX secretion-associated protein EspG, partial [Pseudonocardia nigra]|uniref:ESX secretion-associated protein EspG n=1 Tax=Pseudonocardia nigra TaxID=1921578 RepID=UPI001C5CE1D3